MVIMSALYFGSTRIMLLLLQQIPYTSEYLSSSAFSPPFSRNFAKRHIQMSSFLFSAALLLPVALTMPISQTSTSITSSSGWSDSGITWMNPSSTVAVEKSPAYNSKNNRPCQSWQSSCYDYNNGPKIPSNAGSSIVTITGDAIGTSITKEKRKSTKQKRQGKSKCYRNNKVVTCPSTVPLSAASSSFGGMTLNPNFSNKPTPNGAPTHGPSGPKIPYLSMRVSEADVAEGNAVRNVDRLEADVSGTFESER
jgi:hypothetical protein